MVKKKNNNKKPIPIKAQPVNKQIVPDIKVVDIVNAIRPEVHDHKKHPSIEERDAGHDDTVRGRTEQREGESSEEDTVILRGKGLFNECESIYDIIEVLRDFSEYLIDLNDNGFDLLNTVEHDKICIGFVGHNEDEDGNEDGDEDYDEIEGEEDGDEIYIE